MRRHHHAPNEFLRADDLVAGHYGGDTRLESRCRAVHDRLEFVFVGVVDQEFEHEPVELSLGQRIRSLLLDRVLGGHHEERFFERVARSTYGDGVLLHRFEHGRLRFGRCPIDLVGQHDLGEERSALKLERSFSAGRVFRNDRGADDVRRHQVGRELNSCELKVHSLGQRADPIRFAESGNAFDQYVPSDQQRRQYTLDDLLVPDDRLADFLAKGLKLAPKLFRRFLDRRINLIDHGWFLSVRSLVAKNVNAALRMIYSSSPLSSGGRFLARSNRDVVLSSL